ncbi:MAG: YfhO family protein [Armatimonadota bacterium]|nr:MAG: YfhO family protein [Armatimonadota bacterium]
MPERSHKTTRCWWPVLVIVGAACAFCWPVFLGRIMLPADMCLLMLPWRALQSQFPDFHRVYNPMLDPIQQYLPWRIYAVESLRAGFIPLWNPYAFCGTPFLANLQSTVLYPPNLLFLLTGARHGFGVSAILHLALGGLSMYAFLRTLGLRRGAGLLGALVLMFNGFTVTWLEYPTLSLWVFMWLPAILLCYERALREPRSLWTVGCALALGMQFLGGHLQVSAYVVMAFLLYVVVRIIGGVARERGRAGAAALAVIPLVLGLALAACQILPTLELAQHSGRVSHGAGAAVGTAFPLSRSILYLMPNFFGNPLHYNYWGNYEPYQALNFFETACYVGILPLLLAAWALRHWRKPEVWFFGGLTLFAVLAAIGSPLYLLVYYVVPGFRELAGLARVLCLACFGLAGLAAFGLDDLLRRESPSSARCPIVCAFVFGVAGLLAAALVWRLVGFDGYLLLQLLALLALLAASVAVVALRARMRVGARAFALLSVAVLVLDLFGFGMRFNPFVDVRMTYPDTESTRWLQEHAGHARVASLVSRPMSLDWMAHNSAMIFGLRDIHGSDSLRVRRSFELVSGPNLDQANYPEPDSPLLDRLGVKYLMTRRSVGDGWTLATDVEAPIYENLEAYPRAYVVAEDGGKHPAAARFERDEPDRVVLTAQADSPGALVLTDSYYPGWRAWVDGKPVPIELADDAFRAVGLPPGEHTVEMRYDPASFRVGMFVSLLAAALLAALAAASYLARRSTSAEATASRS